MPLKVLFACAEAAPLAKVGGLGDVAGALPEALRRLGHDVRVVLPHYRGIDAVARPIEALPVPVGAGLGRLGRTSLPGGTPVYLLGVDRYFNRADVYGYDDDPWRFAAFSRACLELPAALGWSPDIFHCHDWHTALIPQYLAAGPEAPATVLTIHNLAYQGISPAAALAHALPAPGPGFAAPGEGAGTVNLLARGLWHSDAVSAVSPTYAREILTPEHGEGLDPLLRRLRPPPVGILNGIDVAEYAPESDPAIAANYGPETLARKKENKLALQRELGLSVDPRVPLVSMVTRLVEQKGIDLVAAIIEPLCRYQQVQFVLLGGGEPHYHQVFAEAAARHPGRIGVRLGFDAALAHRVYAGADIFLMPSRFEPCGLGQLIALHYGTVPVVRGTGGLADTVTDFDAGGEPRNGFVFDEYEPLALYGALVRAITVYRFEAAWHRLMRQGMGADHSWNRAAEAYVDLYRAARERRARR